MLGESGLVDGAAEIKMGRATSLPLSEVPCFRDAVVHRLV
jgi:hypothetical protein